MPISKIKGNAINDDAINSDRIAENIEFTGTHVKLPSGTTAQRPGSPAVGYVRYNTTIGVIEQYMVDGWQAITVPPIISSINIDNFNENDDPQTLVISGSNFDTLSTAVLLDSGGNTVTPTTSTRNSASQITIVFSGSDTLTTDNGPYDVRVTTGTGLTATTENALTLDNAPSWTTASGSLGTVYEDVAISTITVVATDPEGESVTYSITSGSLPTGLSLGSSNGEITGTPNVNDTYNASGVTHNFTVTADDGTGNTTPQSFSILRKWVDGSTSALAVPSATSLIDLGITDNGWYWVQPPDAPSAQKVPCILETGLGDSNRGYIYVVNHSSGSVTLQPRMSAYSAHCGSGAYNWSSGYDFESANSGSFENFNVNLDGWDFDHLIHCATGTGANSSSNANWLNALSSGTTFASLVKAYYKVQFTQKIKIPNTEKWAVGNDGSVNFTTSNNATANPESYWDSSGSVNQVTGLGAKRLQGATNTYTDDNRYHPVAFGLAEGYTTGGGAGGFPQINGGPNSNSSTVNGNYPVWISAWTKSGGGRTINPASETMSDTFSFADANDSGDGSTGWDDFQDGSGMGDSWSNESGTRYQGYPNGILLRM